MSYLERYSENARKWFDLRFPAAREYFKEANRFLESPSMLAKIAFLALVIICFMIILKIGVYLLNWYYQPNEDPYLIKNMKDARTMEVIPQNPNNKNAIPIIRSKNQDQGVEFTYSIWIYIESLRYNEGQYKHIFHKGNDNIDFVNEDQLGLNHPNNGPGLYIHPTKNTLVVIMNTFKVINEKIEINNVPLNKWLNVIIRVENRNLDVYVNGNIKARHVLSSVPKQNYGDVYVNMNGGFQGYVSKFRYFNRGLNVREIAKINNKGPSFKSSEVSIEKSTPPYFSLLWYNSK